MRLTRGTDRFEAIVAPEAVLTVAHAPLLSSAAARSSSSSEAVRVSITRSAPDGVEGVGVPDDRCIDGAEGA